MFAMSGVFGGQMRENRDQDDVARKAADLCVRFLGETVSLDAQEVTFWRKVFLDNRVSREDLELSISYLTIVPMEKRREWFGVLGFSPEVGVVSVWGTLRGYDNLAKYFSWQLRSTIGQNYEGEDYYVMFPEVGANGSCNDMCQYFGSSVRVGPEFMVKHSVRKIFPQDKVFVGELYEVRVKEPAKKLGTAGFSSLFDEENRSVTSGKLGLQPTLLDVVTVETSFVASERLDELGFSFDDGKFNVQRMAVGLFPAKYVLRAVCNMIPSIRDLRLRYDGVDYSNGVVHVPRFRDAMVRWKFREPLCDPTTISKEIVRLGSVGYDGGGWTGAVEKGLAQLAHSELSSIVTLQQALDTIRGRFVNWDRFPGVRRDGVDTAVYVGFSGSGFDKRMVFAHVVLQRRAKRGYDVLWSADWFPSNDEIPFDVTGLISYKDIEFGRVPSRLNCGRPSDEFSYGMFVFDGFNVEILKLLNAQPGVVYVEEKRVNDLCGCGLRHGDEIDELGKSVSDDLSWRDDTAERLSQLNRLLQNRGKED